MCVFGGAALARGAPGNHGQRGLVRERGFDSRFDICHRGVDQWCQTVFRTDQQTEVDGAG